jgi:hypothetical protein
MRPGVTGDEQVLLHVFVEIYGEDRHLQLLTRWATELHRILLSCLVPVSHPIGHQGNSQSTCKNDVCNIIKVKFLLCLTKHHAIKTYWGSGVIASRILNLGTKWRLVVSFTPRPL